MFHRITALCLAHLASVGLALSADPAKPKAPAPPTEELRAKLAADWRKTYDRNLAYLAAELEKAKVGNDKEAEKKLSTSLASLKKDPFKFVRLVRDEPPDSGLLVRLGEPKVRVIGSRPDGTLIEMPWTRKGRTVIAGGKVVGGGEVKGTMRLFLMPPVRGAGAGAKITEPGAWIVTGSMLHGRTRVTTLYRFTLKPEEKPPAP